MSSYTGLIAGLLTSVCWSFTSIFFTLSGRLVGSRIVNRTRLLLAFIIVTIVHWIAFGLPLPFDASPSRWGWMALSGLIGFTIGDAFLFQAFVMIGPRLAMLVMALNPVIGTFLAWVLLGETLNITELMGITLALTGVVWVIADRQNGEAAHEHTRRYYMLGLLSALGGAIGQAGGYIASKQGLSGDFPAMSGNAIRLVTATGSIWLFAAFNGQVRQGFEVLRQHPRAIRFITGGAIFGPFVGVWLSLEAVKNAPVGVASTLTSLMPVILLPLGKVFFDEKITRRAVAGTILAMLGTAVLFLNP